MSIGGGTPKDRNEMPLNSNNKPSLTPLEVNGITAVTLGTFAWVVALIVLLLSRGWLAETGRSHWIWIAFSGIVLGLLGYRYTTNRVKRLSLERGLGFIARMKKKFGSAKEPDQSQLIQDFE